MKIYSNNNKEGKRNKHYQDMGSNGISLFSQDLVSHISSKHPLQVKELSHSWGLFGAQCVWQKTYITFWEIEKILP